MGNIMENVKKAQQLVQVEAAKAQEELARYCFRPTFGYMHDVIQPCNKHVVFSHEHDVHHMRWRRAEFEGYSDDETVRVVMSGNQEPKAVEITETAMEKGSDVSN